MPPKIKYTRDEIMKAAFEMARKKGIDAVAARELARALGTSTSPIFTAFKKMEELYAEVRKLAMKEFEVYVSDALNYTPAFKYVGMRMINQFHFLYSILTEFSTQSIATPESANTASHMDA